jgi:hypothetical protein
MARLLCAIFAAFISHAPAVVNARGAVWRAKGIERGAPTLYSALQGDFMHRTLTVFAIVCLTLVAAAAAAAEPPRPALVPEDFVFAFHNKKTDEDGVSTILLEYVPKGETVDNWTEMVTVVLTVFDGKEAVTPATQAALIAEGWKLSCPGGAAEVVQSSPQAGSQAGLRATCPKSPQTGKREAVYMKMTLYGAPEENRFVLANVQRAVSGDKPMRSMEFLQKWVEAAQDFGPKK